MALCRGAHPLLKGLPKKTALLSSESSSHSVVSDSCDRMDCSPPGSSVHRIFQARILEWVAISYSISIFKGVRMINFWWQQSDWKKNVWGSQCFFAVSIHLLLLLLLSRFSRVRFCATPQMAAHQAPLPMGFSRQEYWSGVPLPSPQFTCSLCLIAKVPTMVTMLGRMESFKNQNLGTVSFGSRYVLIWGLDGCH